MDNNKQDKKRKYKCCICNNWVKGYGNNPLPIKEKGKCCDECNKEVITERFKRFYYGKGDIRYLK